MTDQLIAEFQESFDEKRYPVEFLIKFELMECLAQNEFGETLLVKDRKTGEYYVAKCYLNENSHSQTSEGELLKKLNHLGVPRLIGEYDNETMFCVVRTYSPGKSLDLWVREKPLPIEQSVQIAIQLCDILHYLHSQNPPVIHRDIKPQNIIVNEEGEVNLIDFGISRTYDQAASEDTVCFGTKKYAAPEQYGYSQTDCRADIFSLGILLLWMITGSVDLQSSRSAIGDKRLVRIIEKCSSFAPQDRYKNTLQVRDALTGRTRRQKIIAVVTALLGVLTVAGILFNPFSARIKQIEINRFKEPLIEQAVRLTLEKTDGEQISDQDLDTISALYVFGDKAAGNAEAFQQYADDFANNNGNIHQGGITTLKDLKKFKNLKEISIDYQNVTDVSPLAEIAGLQSIDLRHNPIEDVSPLANLPDLTHLILFGTNVSDLTALHKCSRLTVLDVGGTLVTSTSAIHGLDALEKFVIRKAPLQTLEGIETHLLLTDIYLSETPLRDLSPLLDLPNLQIVEISEDMRSVVESLQGKNEFMLVYQ